MPSSVQDIRESHAYPPPSPRELLAWGLAVFCALAAIAFIILLCIWGWHPHWGPQTGVTQTAVLNRPKDFYGKDVAVSGIVDHVFSDRGFTIGGKDYGGELLVVAKQVPSAPTDRPTDQPLAAGDVVMVIGHVHSYRDAALAKEISARTGGELYEAYADKPVLIADQVAITPMVASTHNPSTPPPLKGTVQPSAGNESLPPPVEGNTKPSAEKSPPAPKVGHSASEPGEPNKANNESAPTIKPSSEGNQRGKRPWTTKSPQQPKGGTENVTPAEHENKPAPGSSEPNLPPPVQEQKTPPSTSSSDLPPPVK
jgi:hypothetical protein